MMTGVQFGLLTFHQTFTNAIRIDMLHAIDKGKTKFYERYLGKRDGSEHKVYEEDEITSTVFGPLEFLPASEIYRFWCRVLQFIGHAEFLPNDVPSDVQVTLWPRRNAENDGNSIEPDGMVSVEFADGRKRLLLIELKWRAGLSGDGQLHRQWEQYLNKEEQSQSLHLFIAPEISAGAQALSNLDVWGGSRLVLLPWLKLRVVFGVLALENSKLGRWAQLADQFLHRIGIRRFGGFCNLTPPFKVSSEFADRIFWIPHKYSGLAVCGPLPALSNRAACPVFFAPTWR